MPTNNSYQQFRVQCTCSSAEQRFVLFWNLLLRQVGQKSIDTGAVALLLNNVLVFEDLALHFQVRAGLTATSAERERLGFALPSKSWVDCY